MFLKLLFEKLETKLLQLMNLKINYYHRKRKIRDIVPPNKV